MVRHSSEVEHLLDFEAAPEAEITIVVLADAHTTHLTVFSRLIHLTTIAFNSKTHPAAMVATIILLQAEEAATTIMASVGPQHRTYVIDASEVVILLRVAGKQQQKMALDLIRMA